MIESFYIISQLRDGNLISGDDDDHHEGDDHRHDDDHHGDDDHHYDDDLDVIGHC